MPVPREVGNFYIISLLRRGGSIASLTFCWQKRYRLWRRIAASLLWVLIQPPTPRRVAQPCRASRCLAMIVAEQPTEALSTSHLSAVTRQGWLRCDAVVGEALMIAFHVIVGQVLLDRIIQGAFTQHDHPLQRLLLDRAHKPFTVGVEIRTPWRQDKALNQHSCHQPPTHLLWL